MTATQKVLNALQARGLKTHREKPGQWQCQCPAHDDQKASLAVAEGQDGRALVRCLADCSTQAVIEALGLHMSDLFSGNGNGGKLKVNDKRSRRGKIVKTYRYTDEKGAELFSVSRFEPKDFRQSRPGPDGKRVWNTKGTRKVPFHLPALLRAAQGGETVYVVEGEKDVASLERLGLTATTGPGGAGKWRPEYNAHFKGASRAVIIADADVPGRKHAQVVAASLAPVVPDVRVLELPGAKDLSDWVEAGGTLAELDRLVEQAPKWTASEPGQVDTTATIFDDHMTDLGLARRFVAVHQGRVKYCSALGWLVYDGKRFKKNESLGAEPQAVIRAIYADVAAETDDQKRRALAGWARTCESRAKIDAMIELARRQDEIRIDVDQLDTREMFLNCENGTVDLETGELLPHDPAHLITQLVPVPFDPNAEAPRFAEFLSEIMLGRQELIDFLQRLFGYCATGSAGEQKFFVFYGDGENGKSTLLACIRGILGDHAREIKAQTLMRSNQHEGAALSEIAQCRSMRMVTAGEPEAGAELNEAMIKQITGGDPMVGKMFYKDPFTFNPQFSLILSTNDRPFIRGRKHATWRRVCLVPFDWRVTKKVDHFEQELLKEAPGILTWIVQGALRWQAEGLNSPVEVEAAVEKYRSETDILGDFFRDQCVMQPTAEVGSTPLYQAYKAWCERNGERARSHTKFGRLLDERGFGKDRRGGAMVYLGIGLLDTDHEQESLL